MRSFIFLIVCLFPATVLAGDLECVSTLSGQVCVGQSHDSILSELGKGEMSSQTVSQGVYGMTVSRNYLIGGKTFRMTFERTTAEGPYRLTRIEN